MLAPLWGQVLVDEEAVHGAQAGSAARAHNVGDLKGGRAPGEGEQTVARGVAGQVDQHVDPVLADEVSDRLVREADRGPPVVGDRHEPLRDRVGLDDVGVAVQLHPGPVVGRQQGLHEEADGVIAEVR